MGKADLAMNFSGHAIMVNRERNKQTYMPVLVYITIVLIILSVLISIAIYRIRTRRLYASLNRMLEKAMAGTLTETDFDESLHSALENRFYHYLSASETSANNVKAERARIKELISDISHQTKTPISNILLYTELLSEQELSKSGREYIQSLTAQTTKLRFLIDSLVKMSRLESGVFTLVPEYAPLAPMFDKLQTQFALPAEQKGLSLTFQPTDISAVFDEKWTLEAVGNILDNAIKYTEHGGITVKAVGYDLFSCIQVLDTGMGISEEEFPKIFSRFHRSPNVHNEEGVGIGLYLSREIITKEGGYIKVDSTVGKGTTFYVYLRSETSLPEASLPSNLSKL